MKKILLVEPDFMLSDCYETALSGQFAVYVARDPQSAIDVLDTNQIDLIITDVLVASHNGVEIIHELRSYSDWINIPVVMLSSLPITDFPIDTKHWVEYGIQAFAYKPKTTPIELAEMVTAVVK